LLVIGCNELRQCAEIRRKRRQRLDNLLNRQNPIRRQLGGAHDFGHDAMYAPASEHHADDVPGFNLQSCRQPVIEQLIRRDRHRNPAIVTYQPVRRFVHLGKAARATSRFKVRIVMMNGLLKRKSFFFSIPSIMTFLWTTLCVSLRKRQSPAVLAAAYWVVHGHSVAITFIYHQLGTKKAFLALIHGLAPRITRVVNNWPRKDSVPWASRL
jgi:hypothetical protein